MGNGGKYTSPMDPTGNLTTCIPFVCMSHPFLYCPLGCFVFSVGCFLVMDELWHSYMATAFRRSLQLSCWYPVLRRLVTSSTWRRDKRHGDLVSVDYSREDEGNKNDSFRNLCREWINSACCTHISEKYTSIGLPQRELDQVHIPDLLTCFPLNTSNSLDLCLDLGPAEITKTQVPRMHRTL